MIQTKGRVACELNAGDELLATELIFAGVFNDMEPEQVWALLFIIFVLSSYEYSYMPPESPLVSSLSVCGGRWWRSCLAWCTTTKSKTTNHPNSPQTWRVPSGD